MLYGLILSFVIALGVNSLNPYFFGKCSTAAAEAAVCFWEVIVLILIFLENALRHCFMLLGRSAYHKVLILIFLENALRPQEFVDNKPATISLNPYFFGKCSTALLLML